MAEITKQKFEFGVLGQTTAYSHQYNPQLLFAIDRSLSRQQDLSLPYHAPLPFVGLDIWNGYELSWLNLNGKPQVACVCIEVPAQSPAIVESKSLKLYLNSFNQTRFSSLFEVQQRICEDLSLLLQCPVGVRVNLLNQIKPLSVWAEPKAPFFLLDDLDVVVDDYQHNINLLAFADTKKQEKQIYVSHLLKSNCPVTQQPDWASLYIEYHGPALNREGLLRYICSFREHQGFHEACVEQIFMDIWRKLSPSKLSVYARYTRRGGLDINPWRSSYLEKPADDLLYTRWVRQ